MNAPPASPFESHSRSASLSRPIEFANYEMPEQVDVKFPVKPPLEWSFALEHQDRRKEANADAVMHGAPFQVDRSLLRDVVREVICGEDGEHRGTDVARIVFLSSGTFHKAYLITLSDHSNLVARVARRFMPNLKTESEVATLEYLRHHTSIPVPKVYHYDSNPYNRLGGEYILMTQAPGTPLATVYHSLSYEQLVRLMRNLAQLIVGDIWRHRFSALGSLYLLPKDAPEQEPSPSHSAGRSPLICRSASGFLGWSVATPKISQLYPNVVLSGQTTPKILASTPLLSSDHASSASATGNVETADEDPKFTIGPIVSWPFFGSNRGDLSHPDEIFRGPWSTTEEYLASCAERELKGVIRENEGKAAPHRIHLDPDEINASRHHRLRALEGVGDESDDSDEYDLDESEDEWAGPGDAMYRDYRRMQRTTFLMVHLREREDTIHNEMGRWMRLMKKLISALESKNSAELGDCRGPEDNVGEYEEFGLDCHDLSLENVFVDNNDPTKITCIIDWESTSTRPLWQCAHLPAFLQSSPFTARLFRQVVRSMITEHAKADACNGETSTSNDEQGLALLAREWLHYEALGARLRLAHRFVEWDGWEEGLIDTIIGPEEREDEWLVGTEESAQSPYSPSKEDALDHHGWFLGVPSREGQADNPASGDHSGFYSPFPSMRDAQLGTSSPWHAPTEAELAHQRLGGVVGVGGGAGVGVGTGGFLPLLPRPSDQDEATTGVGGDRDSMLRGNIRRKRRPVPQAAGESSTRREGEWPGRSDGWMVLADVGSSDDEEDSFNEGMLVGKELLVSHKISSRRPSTVSQPPNSTRPLARPGRLSSMTNSRPIGAQAPGVTVRGRQRSVSGAKPRIPSVSVSKPPATSNGKSVDLRLAPIASKSILKPSDVAAKPSTSAAPLRKLGTTVPKLPFQIEDEKERMLDTTGDICGGRGGELGRRLEAWISVTGNEERLMHDD